MLYLTELTDSKPGRKQILTFLLKKVYVFATTHRVQYDRSSVRRGITLQSEGLEIPIWISERSELFSLTINNVLYYEAEEKEGGGIFIS